MIYAFIDVVTFYKSTPPEKFAFVAGSHLHKRKGVHSIIQMKPLFHCKIDIAMALSPLIHFFDPLQTTSGIQLTAANYKK